MSPDETLPAPASPPAVHTYQPTPYSNKVGDGQAVLDPATGLMRVSLEDLLKLLREHEHLTHQVKSLQESNTKIEQRARDAEARVRELEALALNEHTEHAFNP